MKKCPYCAKEIGYHDAFCSDECQKSMNDFHDARDKNQSAFSAFNGILVIGIGICIFLYAFLPSVALIAGSVCLMLLGVMYLMFPIPADVMIEKYKLKKALFLTRIIATAMLAIGAVVLVLHLIGVI